MLGNFIKRLLATAVLGLAALAFFLMPIGRKTAFQHVVAILSSAPAREAGASFAGASRRAAASVKSEVRRALDAKRPEKSHPQP